MNLRDLWDEWLWDRAYARLEREAARLRRHRLWPPNVVWANGTWPIWNHAIDQRLAEIEREQEAMLGIVIRPHGATVH